jgi:hypothetical protein
MEDSFLPYSLATPEYDFIFYLYIQKFQFLNFGEDITASRRLIFTTGIDDVTVCGHY